MVVIKKIRCPECNSAETYGRLLGFRCRHCNNIFKKEDVKLDHIDKKESEQKVDRRDLF
ncbi:unnamed protein product [marine sediment metagenome]|uniref:Uncharacterized protein n=1 Tax=marine sediment metagenome TaxID=412755 RepID=X1FCH5_9ZZZZ